MGVEPKSASGAILYWHDHPHLTQVWFISTIRTESLKHSHLENPLLQKSHLVLGKVLTSHVILTQQSDQNGPGDEPMTCPQLAGRERT